MERITGEYLLGLLILLWLRYQHLYFTVFVFLTLQMFYHRLDDHGIVKFKIAEFLFEG